MTEYDVQTHLIRMEDRLNDSLKGIATTVDKIDQRSIDTDLKAVELAGRVVAIEDTQRWIKKGLAAASSGVIYAVIAQIKYTLWGR